MRYKIKHHRHSVGQNTYHLVWSTKYRLRTFSEPLLSKICEAFLRLICYQNKMQVYELRVLPDHVHLFVDLPPTMSVSKAFQQLKGRSTRSLRRNFAWFRDREITNIWSPGKFFRSVGSVTAETIEHYIKHSNNYWDYYNRC